MWLWIPGIGDAFTLDSDWTFTLHPEHRNSDLYEAEGDPFGQRRYWCNKVPERTVTFPAGSELVVDRVYIRQGADEYSSVTFMVKGHPTSAKHFGCRFWAKLDDVNTIECTPTTQGNPIGPASRGHYRNLALPQEEQRKKARARDERKRRKEELEVARLGLIEALRPPLITSGLAAELGARLDEIITDIIDRNAGEAQWRGYDPSRYRTNPHYVRDDLLSPWKPERTWVVDGSRHDRETGLTTRQFTAYVRGEKYPAFTVVSDGLVIKEIKARR